MSVVLASASPRRKELLSALVSEFEVLSPDVDESEVDADPWVTAQRLAREKALAAYAQRPESWVIAGDTVVAIQQEDHWRQFAKPKNPQENEEFLKVLSGRRHAVISGVALRWPGGLTAFTDTAWVTFRTLTPEDIQEYVATQDGLDKAGGYGIQNGAQKFLSTLEGDLDTVIGLPTQRLREALQEARFPYFSTGSART